MLAEVVSVRFGQRRHSPVPIRREIKAHFSSKRSYFGQVQQEYPPCPYWRGQSHDSEVCDAKHRATAEWP